MLTYLTKRHCNSRAQSNGVSDVGEYFDWRYSKLNYLETGDDNYKFLMS